MGLWSKDENEGSFKEEIRKEAWEYARFLFDWRHNALEINEAKLNWAQMWDMYAQMGNEGWEMITCAPISNPKFGHSSGDTNKLLFVLKRRIEAKQKK